MTLWIISVILWIISAIGSLIGCRINSTHPITIVSCVSMWVFMFLEWICLLVGWGE